MTPQTQGASPLIPQSRIVTTAAWIAVLIAVFWILRVARSFLIPLVLAFIALYLVEIVNRLWLQIPWIGRRMPSILRTAFSAAMILGSMYGAGSLIASNAEAVARQGPKYAETLNQLYIDLLHRFNLQESALQDRLLETLNDPQYLVNVSTGLMSMVGNGALIVAYLAMMLVDRPLMPKKVEALFPSKEKRASVMKVLKNIDHDIRVYLGVKTFVSILTGAISYLIMAMVNLDFAAFWAFLIFAFNYVPNIGSTVATILPSFLALAQFDTIGPFLVIVLGIATVQIIIGNLVEPALMGASLNMSPLVVILSLVLWAILWGVAGMFLCVPITTALMIVLGYFDRTRWVAILLSRDGRLRPTD